MQTSNAKRPGMLLPLLLLCAVASSGCQTRGPVLRPQAQVTISPMPDRPQPQGAQTARRELLQPQTPTRPQ